MLEVSNLETIDYEILKFINAHGRVSESALLQHFSEDKDVVLLRLNLLASPDISNHRAVPCTSYLDWVYKEYEDEHHITHQKFAGFYEINSFGKKVLRDHKEKSRAKTKEYWIRSVIVPFFVSLVTAVVTTIATLSIAKHLEPYL